MENGKRGQEGFFDEKKGSKEIFRAKKRACKHFSENKGGGPTSFFREEKRGANTFLLKIFETLPKYLVNFGRSLR